MGTSDRSPVGVDDVHCAFAYEGVARKLVLDLKVRHLRCAARPLAAGLLAAVWERGVDVGAVTWVPGRRRDNLDRGFDHARVLAAGVARRTGLPLLPVLERVTTPRDQAGLSRERRFANLAGAFRARPCHGARWLVIDDLITTGATAAACADALKGAGAARVEVAAACRA